METIDIMRRNSGPTIKNVRMRLRDKSGQVQLYHRTGITATAADLDKLTATGEKKPRVAVFNHHLSEQLQEHVRTMKAAYKKMVMDNVSITSEVFERYISSMTSGNIGTAHTILEYYSRFMRERETIVGTKRMADLQSIEKILARFLHSEGKEDIPPSEFTPQMVTDFRSFLSSEQVCGKQRKKSSCIQVMSIVKTFFAHLAATGVLTPSPFARLDTATRRAIFKQPAKDAPICLQREEIDQIRRASIPVELEECRAAFLLHVAIGCRVGDLSRLTMKDIRRANDGFLYITYIPGKTAKESIRPLTIPLVRFAAEIAVKYQLKFPIVEHPFRYKKYNDLLPLMLKACGVDREIPIINEETMDVEYFPLWQKATTHVARKTHINLCRAYVVETDITGHHAEGSTAAERYIDRSLNERFKTISAAFGEATYLYENGEFVLNETEDQRLSKMLSSLSEEDKKILQKFFSNSN